MDCVAGRGVSRLDVKLGTSLVTFRLEILGHPTSTQSAAHRDPSVRVTQITVRAYCDLLAYA